MEILRTELPLKKAIPDIVARIGTTSFSAGDYLGSCNDLDGRKDTVDSRHESSEKTES